MEHIWISGPTRLDLMNMVHASHPGGKGSGRGEEETVSIGGRGVMQRSGRLFWSAGSLSEGGMSSWSESGRVMKASKGMVADELGQPCAGRVLVLRLGVWGEDQGECYETSNRQKRTDCLCSQWR